MTKGDYDSLDDEEDFESLHDAWAREAQEIIDCMNDNEDFTHVVCYRFDEDDEFELFYANVGLDKILKASIDEYGEITFETLDFSQLSSRCPNIFYDVLSNVGVKQIDKFSFAMAKFVFTCAFGDSAYPISMNWTEWNHSKLGNYTVRTLEKEQIANLFNCDVKFPYDICFFENGETLIMTKLVASIKDDQAFAEKIKQQKRKYLLQGFYTAHYPENFHDNNSDLCFKAFLTDNRALMRNFKEAFQEIGAEGLGENIFPFIAYCNVLKINLNIYIQSVEEQCNKLFEGRDRSKIIA